MRKTMINIVDAIISICRLFFLPKIGEKKWIFLYFIIIFTISNFVIIMIVVLPMFIINNMFLSIRYYIFYDGNILKNFYFFVSETFEWHISVGGSMSLLLSMMYAIFAVIVEKNSIRIS